MIRIDPSGSAEATFNKHPLRALLRLRDVHVFPRRTNIPSLSIHFIQFTPVTLGHS